MDNVENKGIETESLYEQRAAFRAADIADQAAGVPADDPERVARNMQWGELCEKILDN